MLMQDIGKALQNAEEDIVAEETKIKQGERLHCTPVLARAT